MTHPSASLAPVLLDPVPSPHELPVYRRLGVEIAAGEGVTVTTTGGERLIDFYGGHAVASLGYGHPRLLAALRAQAETLFFQTNLVELAVRRRACEKLAALAPDGLDLVFLVSSGAEANENALRLAFRKTGRTRVVAVEGAFHGRTAAAAACTFGAARWFGFPREPFDVTFVRRDDAPALAAALGEDVAALIVEPVQGVAGAIALDAGWLRRARALTAERGALLIADEVQSGMGRTGRAFAIEHAGVAPDIITTAKGLAGGFPAGAVITTDAVAGSVGPGDLGTTFGGGPLAAALIAEVADVLAEPGFLAHVAAMGERIRETCRVGPVASIEGRGLLVGLRTRPPAAEVIAALRARGILAGGAADPHIVRLMPPLVIGPEHVDALRDALASIGHDVTEENRASPEGVS